MAARKKAATKKTATKRAPRKRSSATPPADNAAENSEPAVLGELGEVGDVGDLGTNHPPGVKRTKPAE